MAVQSYQEKEQSLYSDLSTLIKDASWLRHYIASALKVIGEALTGSAVALGDNTRPEQSSLAMSTLSLGSKGGNESGKPSPIPTSSSNEGARGSVQSQGTGPTSHPGSAQDTHPPVSNPSPAEGETEGASNPFLASGVIPQ